MGYSGSIHGVFICIGYVSVMYRLCIGTHSEFGGEKWKGEREKVKTERGKGKGENGKVRGEKGKRRKEELFDKLVEQQQKDLHI